MRDELNARFQDLLAYLRRVAARSTENRFWIELAAFTVLAIFATTMMGRSAFARADAIEREADRLAEIPAAMDRWAGNIQWPSDAETLSWRESEQLLRGLDVATTAPLTLAHQIAQRGEEIGRADVRIRLASPDTAYIPPGEAVGPLNLSYGRSAFVVELTGDWTSIVSFLGVLPPQVEVSRLELSSDGGRVSSQLLLLTREITEEGNR
jgi:hypothetical protein